MAVTKIWKVRGRIGKPIEYAMNPEKTENPKFTEDALQSLRDVMNYAVNEEKTEKQLFVSGVNCDPKTARDEFQMTKESFGKEGGIIAYHAYQSFRPGETTPEQAHEIGVKLAERLWGKDYQVIVATHLNTQCLHNHLVINSVSFRHGKRCQNYQWQEVKRVSDELCRDYGLSTVRKFGGKGMPYALAVAEREGKPTRLNMAKEAIDTAISQCKTLPEFQYTLRTMGYYTQFDPKRKYWTVRQKNWKQPIRLTRLGEEYTNERIVERLMANPESVRMERIQNWRRKEPSALEKLIWHSSLKNLYLYYCYQLGYLPKKNPRPKVAQVNPILRDELLKLEKITEETDLLVRENIESKEELLSYRATVTEKMDMLEQERKNLKNERYRKETSGQRVAEIKERMGKITGEMKALRDEIKRCDRIAERSGLMKEKLLEMERKEKEQQKDHIRR